MEKAQLLDQITDEEREMFLNGDCSSCYQFIQKDEQFSSIIRKNLNREELTDEEWEYVLFRLYLLSCKAKVEEDSIRFTDAIFSFLSRIGMKLSKKDSPFYNECYRMVEFVSSIKKEREINADLIDGFYEIQSSKDPTDLDILLSQHEERDLFYKNRRAFLKAYKNSEMGQISINEKMYMRSFQNAYAREKSLNKRRIDKKKSLSE